MNDWNANATMHWPGDGTVRLQRAELLLDLKLTALMLAQLLLLLALPHAQPTQAQAATANHLEVALRGTDGQGIAGVTITLAPRPAELGGPVTQQQARVAVTDAQGWVAFDAVPGGIWLLSFAGSVSGLPVQLATDQGRPPYGTTPDGGGFIVTVGDIGDDIGTDVGSAASAPARVAQALFVGRAQDGVWVPEYDLSDPGQTPEPLSLVPILAPLAIVPTLDVGGIATSTSSTPVSPSAAPSSLMVTATPAIAATAATSAALQTSPLLLCYAPGIALGLGLFAWAWLARRRLQGKRG